MVESILHAIVFRAGRTGGARGALMDRIPNFTFFQIQREDIRNKCLFNSM
jgi:hypothetical protein